MNKIFFFLIIGSNIVNSASYNFCNRSLASCRQLSSVLLKKECSHSFFQRALTTKTIAGQRPNKPAITQATKPCFSLEDGKVVREAYYAKLRRLPWGHVANDYINQFKRQDERLQKEFMDFTECTEEEWQIYLTNAIAESEEGEDSTLKWAAENPTMMGHITGHYRNTVDTILEKCCINPSHINVVWTDPAILGPLTFAVTTNTIYISSSALTKKQKFTKEAIVLAHEAMHIMHNDSVHNIARGKVYERYLTGKTGHARKMYEYQKHRRLIEKRADILGALIDPKYAQRGYTLLSQLIEEGYICPPTYPPFHERARSYKELYNRMSEVSQQKY